MFRHLSLFVCLSCLLALPVYATTLIQGSLSATLSDEVIPGIGGPDSDNPRNDFRGARIAGTFVVDTGDPTHLAATVSGLRTTTLQ